jgi:hypothetical protein
MCGVGPGRGLLAAILAAIGTMLFLNGFWNQFKIAGSWGASVDIVVLFVQYVIAFLFLGAAKMVLWKCKVKEPARKR